MILDRIEHFERYIEIIPEIYDVIKFVEKTKKENLPVGKYPLQNGFALIKVYKFGSAAYCKAFGGVRGRRCVEYIFPSFRAAEWLPALTAFWTRWDMLWRRFPAWRFQPLSAL